ncbi:hypothetical protein K1719_009675 [Acacia pycnantha]|nr:hypothetical protein K1719_009675 [Acacia pycnantha]
MTKTFLLLCFLLLPASGFAFGYDKKEQVGVFELKKGDISLKVSNWGATITSLVLPDKHGKLGDVVLGYDSIKDYFNDSTYFGATVGRVANRIGGAQFTLNGIHYKLVANEGNNTLHGGSRGFSDVVWKVAKYEKEGDHPHIIFTYRSYDGEQGFPGDLMVTVSYYLIGEKDLAIIMKAKALNKPTPVNLANHAYWNLGGHNSGSRIKQLPKTRGYDINYVIGDGYSKKLKVAAKVQDYKSGRVMELSTNAPGVQFYTGNHVENVKGKGGYVYQPHAGLCLETQAFPDSVNHPNFPSTIVTPQKPYRHHMLFRFSTKAQ